MTLQELYILIDGDYDKAISILRIEKLIDKHIRKFPNNTIFNDLNAAKDTMDPVMLFESAHAIKGVCANLGLVKISDLASIITEQYRPGNTKTKSDEEIINIINKINELFINSSNIIRKYEPENQ